MKPRLFFGLAIALALIVAGFLVRNRSDKSGEMPFHTSVNASNAASSKAQPAASAKDVSPASVVSETASVPPVGADKSAPSGAPVIASSVTPGIPMTRSEVDIPRSTSALAAAKLPVRQASYPEARADIQNVGLMFRDFRTRLGGNPVGSNAEIMKAVMGGNSAQATLGPPPGQSLNENGELVDRWGTPYFFHQLSKINMEIRSAGPDRKMWTSDDIVGR